MTEPGWTLVVDPGSAGQRVDRFVAERVPRLSRSRAGRLEVVDLDHPERGLIKKSAAVRPGQRLWVRRPVPDAGAPAPAPAVLHADDDLLVLDKPAGLATHPTASRYLGTVTTWLRAAWPGAEPAHRLDVETSGVLVCARHTDAARALKAAFAERRVHKTYRAVVEGSPKADAWTTDTPLGFDPRSAVRLKMGPGDLPAETRISVIQRSTHRAVIEARPITGRQHQIRVHLALTGHPVVGDKLYGPDEQLFLASLERALTAAELARLGHPRHALHAWRLELELTGRHLTFEAPWPTELGLLLTSA